MNLELRTHQFLAACFCFLIVGLAIAFSLFYAGTSLGRAMKYQADREVVIAAHGEREAKFKALTSMLNLETIRTDIEKANRKVAVAEYRLQAVCKKSKLKC